MNDRVTVYHSEAERSLDEWVWHGGGIWWMAGVLAALALAVIWSEVRLRRRKR